ncbi:MAG: PDZ domain-containing protein [Planctomycetes bacterium]|nr:PDZ domain-containing protein [Planctomycetota bacterium]
MRGVDVANYRFDFDLTFAVLFANARGRIYGRYGSRDADSADGRLSTVSLEKAMERALAVHERERDLDPPARAPAVRVEELPGAALVWPGKKPECIHCHMVTEVEWKPDLAAGGFDKRRAFVDPDPASIGVELDVDEGNLVSRVLPGSPAALAGIEAGDVLVRLGTQWILSQADVQWVLHNAGWTDSLEAVVSREGEDHALRLELPDGWKRGDISWRPSMWNLDPKPGFFAVEASQDERTRLGIPAGQLALVVKSVPPGPSKRGGLKEGDAILAVDGNRTLVPARVVYATIRLGHEVGDRMSMTVLRDGKEVELAIELR